jgi:RNA polymerase-binding transcription factor
MTELSEIKQNLIDRKKVLEARVTAINDDVSHKNEPLSSDWSEQAVERENEEVLEALGNASLEEISHIKRALQRIDEGVYFECQNCGENINHERLKLINFTDLCTECATQRENLNH